MAGVEIRDYDGDFEDVAELARRVWIPEYGGRIWFPLLDASFLRSQLGAQTGGRCIAAYDGTTLVGSMFSIPHSLRIGSSVFPIAFATGFSVEPDHRRLALPLIERLHRFQEERGIAFAISTIAAEPTSIAYRFWTRYAQTFPQNFRFLFSAGYWAKFLEPRLLARAGIKTWERLASRMLGPLLRATPHRYDPHVRLYRAGDLERCAQLLDKASAGLDWALVWSRNQLANELENPSTGTFVFERDGRVQGMVNYHYLWLHGRQPLRTAQIDLWADDDLTDWQRVRLLGHLCNRLRERDVHLVLAPQSAMMPTAAFAANVFLPIPGQVHLGSFWTQRAIALAPPKTWSLLVI